MKPPQFDPAWPAEVTEIWKNDMREMWDPRIERQVYNQYHNQLDLYLGLVEKYAPKPVILSRVDGEGSPADGAASVLATGSFAVSAAQDDSPPSVLDVGCAQGTLSILLAERGHRVVAVDIREPFLDYARTRWERGDVRFQAANIFDKPDLGTFDLVFGNQIIEHLVYPAEFLRTLASYARPGGVVVVSTPNHDYFRSSLPSYAELGDPRQHEHRQFSAGGGDHFFAYTEEELRKAAAEAGLDVLEMIYFETPAISGHFLVRYLHWLPVKMLRGADRLALRIAPRKLAHQLCMVVRRRA